MPSRLLKCAIAVVRSMFRYSDVVEWLQMDSRKMSCPDVPNGRRHSIVHSHDCPSGRGVKECRLGVCDRVPSSAVPLLIDPTVTDIPLTRTRSAPHP